MQKSTYIIKTAHCRKAMDCKNMMLLTLILLPLVLPTFYPNPLVLGQEKEQKYSSNILICQMAEYIESPIGPNMHQVANICSYQNSIGYNQSLAELCFIFSGKSIDLINAFCNKAISKPMSTPTAIVVNETSTPTAIVVNETTTPTAIVNETTTPTAIVNETTTPTAVNQPNDIVNSQSNMDDESRLTIFDGISNFFSNAFNR
jgi:hypothetical protein